MTPIIKELAQKVCEKIDTFSYTWADHLEHYPAGERIILDNARSNILAGHYDPRIACEMKNFTKTGEW
jgi:hypothetical protein